tara:strand:- start:9336 stop:11567 length:2232 start_codon:yes stop_codon:yes gene_type:complete
VALRNDNIATSNFGIGTDPIQGFVLGFYIKVNQNITWPIQNSQARQIDWLTLGYDTPPPSYAQRGGQIDLAPINTLVTAPTNQYRMRAQLSGVPSTGGNATNNINFELLNSTMNVGEWYHVLIKCKSVTAGSDQTVSVKYIITNTLGVSTSTTVVNTISSSVGLYPINELRYILGPDVYNSSEIADVSIDHFWLKTITTGQFDTIDVGDLNEYFSIPDYGTNGEINELTPDIFCRGETDFWANEGSVNNGDDVFTLTGDMTEIAGVDRYSLGVFSFVSNLNTSLTGGYLLSGESTPAASSVVGNNDSIRYVDDDYVEDGYFETYKTILAGFAVVPQTNIESDFQFNQTASVQQNITETFVQVSSLTAPAENRISTSQNLLTDAQLTTPGGIRFNIDETLVSDVQSTVSALLDLSASADLASDVQSTVSALLDLSASADFASDAQLDPSAANLIGFFSEGIGSIQYELAQTQLSTPGGLILQGAADVASDYQVDTTAGFAISGASSIAADAQTDLSGGVIIDNSLSIAADTQLSTPGGILFSVDTNMASDAQMSGTGKNIIITTAQTLLLSDSVAISSAEIALSATAGLASQFTTTPSVGLIITNFSNILFDLQVSGNAEVSISSISAMAGDSVFASTPTVTISGIGTFLAETQVLAIPKRFAGPVLDTLLSEFEVIASGAYLFAIPIYARLDIPADDRTANILAESRIKTVKSETLINTILKESRGLLVPLEIRNMNIHDRSL